VLERKHTRRERERERALVEVEEVEEVAAGVQQR